MGDDIIQQSLALLDACIGVYGPDATRLLPGRAFVQVDLRQRIGSYLKDENYVSVNRKGATILPQYKNLAGLKAFLETKVSSTHFTCKNNFTYYPCYTFFGEFKLVLRISVYSKSFDRSFSTKRSAPCLF
jgi:hypothetical protein